MPRYRNSFVNSRYSLLIRYLQKNTTSRSRRIILINIVCLTLFVVVIWSGYRDETIEISTVPRPETGDVYYVSKRALCSRSIAHEQLGIQPIAVSKVILRPIVRTEEMEAYDDRLEVLENALVNDVVFLDRNVTGKEAELSANVCPLHTISTLPPRRPTRYTASTLVFGITLSVEDIFESLQHWPYWARKSEVSFHILLPSSDYYRVSEAKDLIRESLGINVHVEAAQDTDNPAQLTLMLVESMQKNAALGKEWFIILSPATFVTSVDDVLLALELYNSDQSLYMGGLSESTRQKGKLGLFAYNGAGIVLSRQLLTIIAPYIGNCLKLEDKVYGDGLLASCISKYTSAEFIILPSFHQCDVEDDISGILQAPLEFATLHNLVPSGLPLFPTWHPLGPETSDPATYADQIKLFYQSREILSPQNWGIRYRFGTAERFLLTNGYSITEFLRPPFPTNYDIRNGVEGTFNNNNDAGEFTFHAYHDRGTKELPMRHGLREGDDKRTYYLRAIGYSESQSRTGAGKMNRNEAAVFVYTNEWGNVRRGIEVVWLL